MDSVVGVGTLLAGRYLLAEPRPSALPGASEWAGTDQILVRPVVVRVFDAAGSGPALDAARRASLVSDPRLVRVLDVGSDQGVGYVVSERMTGPTLAQLVGREPLSADQARAVVGEAASALETARRRGVHHLALRPSVVAVSDDGRVLVSGLALDATMLGRGLRDARTTSRTDAADLVRILYAALTGYWPGPLATADGLPTAPEADGAPVPPATLAADVPADLNTLCAVTLGREDDGPLSPADLVRELEPWGEIKVAGRPQAPFPPRTPAGAPESPTAATGQVVRQSVRTAFAGPVPTVNRPGTPPPATPRRTGSSPSVLGPVAFAAAAPPPAPFAGGFPADAPTPFAGPFPPDAAAPSAGSLAADRAALTPPMGVPSAVPPAGPPSRALPGTTQGRPQGSDPFDFGARRDEPTRRTGAVIAVVIVGLVVLVAIGFAAKALLTGLGGSPAARAGSTTAARTPTSGPSASASASGPRASPSPTVRAGAIPAIIGITSIDPTAPGGEHEEVVGKAIDGDPSTFWMTRTYKTANFGGLRPAIGLALTLAEPATISTVTLHVNGTGGSVQIYAGDATTPTKGPVLASGSMSQDTVLHLSPAPTTSTLVIWFTELPTTADGSFRVELTEIALG